MIPRLLTVKDAVVYLGYPSEAALRMAIYRGVIPACCIVRMGGRVKLDRLALDGFIKSKKRKEK